MPLQSRITPDIIADDVLVGDAINQVLRADCILRRIHRRLVRRQRALRAVVDDEQWHKYMLVEELFNDRWARALAIVAKAFFAAGTRARGRRL